MGKYDDRELVFVTPFTGSQLKYGFMTNVDANVKSALGHTAVTGAYPVGLVIGANAPKPPRATRIRATGAESSFVDAESVATARANGWRIRPGKVRIASSSAKSKVVYVTHEGNKLAWAMPMTLYNRITAGDRTALGIVDAPSADEDLIFGVSYPRLPRVGYIAAGTDGTDVLSTFCDPSKLDSLPAGWRSVRASRDKI